ncbi:MAG: SgcJ/EcaC family oxidoreductase [Gemmatimonadaceae bacterium]
MAIVLLGCTQTEGSTMGTGTQAGALAPEDEASVRKVVSEFANTWNRHDMKAMHELNAEGVEWINITGNHWRGNATVYKGHDIIHRTIFANTSMSVEEVQVRALSAEVAIAVATMMFGPVMAPSGQEISELKTRGSFVLVNQGGEWKVVHFQNTSVDPEAERNDPITWDSTGYLPGRSTN